MDTQFSGLLAVSDISICCSLNGKLMAVYLFMCIVSHCVDAQADLSLRWSETQIDGFVM